MVYQIKGGTVKYLLFIMPARNCFRLYAGNQSSLGDRGLQFVAEFISDGAKRKILF